MSKSCREYISWRSTPLTYSLTERMNTLHVVLLAAAFSLLEFKATYGEEIINGHKAMKNSLQYMASVQADKKHICGGFLIDPSYVLTAAHCDTRAEMSVILGTQNIDSQRNLRRYAVKIKYKHPEFKKASKGFDIMLLKLVKEVKLNKDVKIIKIPSKKQTVKPNMKCLVAGWGKTEKGNIGNDLLVTNISTIDFKVCQQQWKDKEVQLPPNTVCAGGYKTKSGACQGDSGGPLVCSGLAVGIVSFNYKKNCHYPNVPNVYTQISPYTDWIKETIKRGA